jgi:hypothetical protein
VTQSVTESSPLKSVRDSTQINRLVWSVSVILIISSLSPKAILAQRYR